MLDCIASEWGAPRQDQQQIFAQDAGISLGLSFETSTLISVFGVEVYQLYDLLVYDLSKKARERIQKLKLLQNTSNRSIRGKRMEITRFLRLVLGSATRMKGQTLCESIAILVNCLPKPMEPLLMYGWNSLYDGEYCGYEIYHGVLEWRWLVLLLTKEVKDVIPDAVYRKGFRKRPTLKAFGKQFQAMMNDMLELALYQFSINAIEDIVDEALYICDCVKHLWLGMMVLAEANEDQINFWSCLTECIPSVLKGRKDGPLFKIWLLNALAQFYERKVSADGTETPCVKLPHNYTLIDDIVKEFLKTDITEQQMRVFLMLIKPIITGLWPVRFETVIALWDYFSVRLNSSFLMKGDSLESLGCVSRSIDGFIQQAATLASPETGRTSLDPKMNSFTMFLILLSSMIRYCTEQSLKTKVQIIFNRIFLKLGPKKYENMTEQAIYNLGLMLLTMISSTSYEEDYPRVSKQMQLVRLIGGPVNVPVDVTVKRITSATQAHMAILVLFSNSRFNKTSHIVTFMEAFEAAYQKYGDRLLPAMEVLSEGTSLILGKAISKGSLAGGETSLIGPWMVKYCRNGTTDRWSKVLDAVSNCLQSPCSATDEEFVNAINQHVMPFVKEQFARKKVAPACIAEIAARSTLNSMLKCAQNNQILSTFNAYALCPTAHTDQVLAYLKVIGENRRMITLLEEKTIIRLWLKMGFYYDREKLMELTRAVHGLAEFRALCEIPEYEMFESKAVPIELFFRFLGKRYREADITVQLEMRKKLHIIFQHFDKWIANPTGLIRQRIFAVLVLALKECAHAFYIKSNSTCLYHIAFQQFFLPFSVLTDRNVQLDLVKDMATVWHRVMEILGRMEYTSDPTIGDNVYNMLIKWVPQFAKLANPDDALRPLMLFFCARNEALVLFAMPRLVIAYVDLQRCLPKSNAPQTMQILQRLIETLVERKDYGKILLCIRIMGLSLMQHAFMCNETFPTRAVAMEMLNDLLSTTEGPSNMIKQEMRNVISVFTHKYLGHSAESYFTFMCRVANRNPAFIRSVTDLIRSEVVNVERARGRGVDASLRNALHRLEVACEQK